MEDLEADSLFGDDCPDDDEHGPFGDTTDPEIDSLDAAFEAAFNACPSSGTDSEFDATFEAEMNAAIDADIEKNASSPHGDLQESESENEIKIHSTLPHIQCRPVPRPIKYYTKRLPETYPLSIWAKGGGNTLVETHNLQHLEGSLSVMTEDELGEEIGVLQRCVEPFVNHKLDPAMSNGAHWLVHSAAVTEEEIAEAGRPPWPVSSMTLGTIQS